MSKTECNSQLEFFEAGRQQGTMSFDGGNVVSDAGLLPIRELDLPVEVRDVIFEVLGWRQRPSERTMTDTPLHHLSTPLPA